MRSTVDVTHDQVTYTLRDGKDGHVDLTMRHDGEEISLDSAAPTVVKISPRVALLDAPTQPAGRAPASHRG